MTSVRRMGPETSASRTALLDATERVLRRDGYAALSSPRVAEEAGLKQQLVYYYFRTMDDLVLATFRRRTERALERLKAILESDRPLHALWSMSNDPANARLSVEFMAIANRNEALREEIVRYLKEARTMQQTALSHILAKARIDPALCPPIVASMLIGCIAQYLNRETSIGMEVGHPEMHAVVEHFIGLLEPPATESLSP